MQSKRILIITYDMVPHAFTWGGCQRMYYLSKSLVETGCHVDIVAMRCSAYNTFGKELLPNVFFTEQPPTVIEQNSKNTTENKQEGRFLSIIRTLLFKCDTLLFNEITAGNGLTAYRRYRKACSTIKRMLSSNRYDVAIVSAPPFVVFNAISAIKKVKPSLRVIMDYRDPWNSWHTGNKLCEQRERKLQNLADLIVCTNQALCNDMSSKYGVTLDKYTVIANGYVEDKCDKIEDSILSKDKMNIVYTGSIGFNKTPDGYRDTSILFDAFKNLIDTGTKGIRLVFVGEANSDSSYLASLKETFGDNLLIVGHVNNDLAKRFVQDADACLLLHTAQDNSGKYLISGKAYDYIQKKKCIFSISRSDSQHSILIKENKIGINVENRQNDIIDGLTKLYEAWNEGGFHHLYDRVEINSFSRQYQINRYIDLIKMM